MPTFERRLIFFFTITKWTELVEFYFEYSSQSQLNRWSEFCKRANALLIECIVGGKHRNGYDSNCIAQSFNYSELSSCTTATVLPTTPFSVRPKIAVQLFWSLTYLIFHASQISFVRFALGRLCIGCVDLHHSTPICSIDHLEIARISLSFPHIQSKKIIYMEQPCNRDAMTIHYAFHINWTPVDDDPLDISWRHYN